MVAPRVPIDALPEATAITGDDLFVLQDSGVTKKVLASVVLDASNSAVDAHIADTTGAHLASAVAATPNTLLTGTDVQTQLTQANNAISSLSTTSDGAATSIADHLADTTDAHDASAVSIVAIPTIVGTDVQTALSELTTRVNTPSGVPLTRLVATTPPLAGGGDLSADRTLSVGTFSAGAAGIVPASAGGTANFLCADGTWKSPLFSGTLAQLNAAITDADVPAALNGLTGVWIGTAAQYAAVSPKVATVVYFVTA